MGKLNKYKVNSDDEQEDNAFEAEVETEIEVEVEEQQATDPRWDELKKILDNN